MSRIKYNKEKLPSRQYGGGGPRDRQAALKLRQQSEMLKQISPTISTGAPKQQEIDLSQYLPLTEVKRKIEEAVTSTIKSERKKFESSLKNLNDQLSEKELVISKLKGELSTKSDKNLEELSYKLDKLYDRISDGSIKHLVGSNMDRPSIEDKIFIDPLEKDAEPDLDSHITVEEDKISEGISNRNINTDLVKLRNLLKS